MANKRIFYAMRRIGIAPNLGPTKPNFQTVRGVQSCGITTQFRLDQVFELGQVGVYDNFEGIPEIECQLEKVLDGYAPIFCLATQSLSADGTSPTACTLVGRAPTQCTVGMQIYDEGLAQASHLGVAEGTPTTEVHMSGLYVSSVRYQVNVERHASETVSFVGNNKVWVIGDTGIIAPFNYSGGNWDTGSVGDANTVAPDTGLGGGVGTEIETSGGNPWTGLSYYPASTASGGGIQRRQSVIMDPTAATTNGSKAFCILPGDLPGLVVSATGSQSFTGASTNNKGLFTYAANTFYINPITSSGYNCHVQNWNVHVDLGREQLHELGRLGNYYRYVNWPVEVVNEISIIALTWDGVSAVEEGIHIHSGVAIDGTTYATSGCGLKYNLNTYPIRLAFCEGLIVDCGKMNKLKSVGMTGGDTGRGNMEITYTYSTFNDFTVLHPQDPVVALRP